MLDCQPKPTTNTNTATKEDPIECKYCQASGDCVGSETVYWNIQLDQDLLETLLNIYPEWFQDCHLPSVRRSPAMAEGGPLLPTTPSPPQPQQPFASFFQPVLSPKAEVDETPIHHSMDKHKESLKVKLLLRRPINQLIDQGIMPPLKTPPAFHEQRQKLERAKMGDLLKSKIQRRPDRQELIQQHILEDSNVDPSLQDKQRQLKKARLADDLNERLSHRPGPLELIKGNILKADELFARAIRDGQIPFKRTCEGETRKHPLPLFAMEEDSSSEGAMSPPSNQSDQSQVGNAPSPPESGAMVPSPGPSSSIVSSLSPLSSVPSPISVGPSPMPPVTMPSMNRPPAQSSVVVSPTSKCPPSVSLKNETTKDPIRNNRKKSKSKSAPKARMIKFHEYKGPPNAQKSNQANAADAETSYELLLQQQQLFLQWQLELQHKYPQIILPAAQATSPSFENMNGSSLLNGVCQSNLIGGGTSISANSASQNEGQSPRSFSKLEDMKVSDLKVELKKRNLPVSGSKPQLIERLKPYTDASSVLIALNENVGQAVGGESSGPNSLNMYGSPQGSPSDEHVALPDTPSSPETPLGDGGLLNRIASPYATPLFRPPSVAPMDVDGNTNVDFDAMDIGEIPRSLPQVSSPPPLPPVTTMKNTSSEDMLRKKIEDLQRELQRSQVQLQERQNLLLQQQNARDALQKQTSHTGGNSTAATTTLNESDVKRENDQKMHQKLVLQQHLHQKILQHQQQQQLLNMQQQQQEQQQQQHQVSVGTSSIAFNAPSNTPNVKASLAAFLQGQVTPSSPLQQQQLKSSSYSNATNVQKLSSPLLESVSKQTDAMGSTIRNGHIRTNSLPTFVGITVPRKTPVSRTITNPQFVFSKPPPDYNEATRQLNKQQQFTQILLDSLTEPPKSTKKYVKSQAVDDVLEILIKNGELPASAAQEPPTPPTPKAGLVNASLIFPEASMKNTPETPLVPVEAIAQSQPPNTFDLDLALDLQALEPMNLEDLGVGKSDSNYMVSSLSNDDVGDCVDIGDEGINMDIDMADVSDWLDAVLPNGDQLAPQQLAATVTTSPMTVAPSSVISNHIDSSDPLLSANQDLFNLFNLDDDFKATPDLGTLSWDKVDFAT